MTGPMTNEVNRDVVARLRSALSDRYHIERELGRGGMATVYLARDLRHDREVAIKVLHPDLGAAIGGERFLTEIKTTAKLQHPHILPLLDSGAADGLLYYAMPYVNGETLRARLEREGQLSIDAARRIAEEVADALGAAHALGVIHRDIKPENILLQGGHALVADFGIALAVQQASGQRMTQTGLSLGTPQYMSPEQAMGEKIIDARSDIYALGAVTYEMLVGEPPFTGPTVQAIVAKTMTERPVSPHAIRDTIPAGLEHAVLRALAKLPADRFASAAEFAAALSAERAPPNAGAIDVRQQSVFGRMNTFTVAACAVAAFAIFAAAWGWLRPVKSEPVTRVAVALPEGQALTPQWRGYSIAISRDGTRLAYVGTGPTRNSTQLWIRRLDELDATAVPNTVGASTVRWAPDGRSLFFSNAVTTTASATVSLESGQVIPAPGSYDGDIGSTGRVFAPGNRTIVRHTPGGAIDTVAHLGKTSPLTLTVLPDESAALVALPADSNGLYAAAKIVAVSLSTGKQTVVGPGIYAQYLSSGHLLYVTATGDAFVAPFDPRNFRITGAATPIARVAFASNSGRLYPQITVSDNGTLAYIEGDVQHHRLTWLDASGKASQQLITEGSFWGIALSPDGNRVAASLRHDAREVGGKSGGVGDIWVEDLRTGARTQLTSADFSVRPSWSADGEYVLYTRVGGPLHQALFERRADASQPERLVLSQAMFGRSVGDGRWLPDHRTLVVRTYADTRTSSRDIYYLMPGSDTTARSVATTAADETGAAPSPDGSLMAYNSDETGAQEVYVQPFPSGVGRLQVSHEGGSTPRWSREGRLYYLDKRNHLVVATIASRPALAVTNQQDLGGDLVPVFAAGNATNSFDVAPDGRVLVAVPVTGAFRLVLVRNFAQTR